MQLVRIVFLSTLFLVTRQSFAQNNTPSPSLRLGSPNVLSSDSSPLSVEIPIQQGATASARVRLALPSVYTQRGVDYPQWLSDAVVSIKNRAGQYRTLLIEAKRGNPDLSTELLLEFESGDVQWIQSYTLMLDHISTFAAAPPPAPSAAQSGPHIGEWIQRVNKPPVQAPVIEDNSTPRNEPLATNKPRPSARAANRIGQKSNTANNKPAPALQVAAATPAVMPASLPAGAASEPALPASDASAPVAAAPMPAPIPVPSTAKKQAWWSDWTALGLGIALLLLIIALLYRTWRHKQVRNAAKAQAKIQQKGFEVTQGQAQANTVFGLSPQEANAMHEQWLSQKLTQK